MNESGEAVTAVPPERLAALGRAVQEVHRYAAPDRDGLEQSWKLALSLLTDTRARNAALKEVDPILGGRRAAAASNETGSAPAAEERGPMAELQKQKASLENRLAGEAETRQDVQRKLQQEQEDHKHAVETLKLQQKQLKEM